MSAANAIEITRQRADRGRDRHLVVVEHDDQTALQMTRLVDRFHRHAAGERGVADQRDDVMIFAFSVACDGHSERRGERSRSVSGAKRVVFRFVAPEKTADAAVLLDRRQQIAPAGQDLVRVSLVTNVPDQPVARRVEGVMQRHCQLDGAERSARMAAHARHRFEDVSANFVGDGSKLIGWKRAQVCR